MSKIKRYLIHTEKIWNDTNWNNLTEFLKVHGKESHVFVMPPQYEYQYSVLGFRGSKEELNKILTKRYVELAELQKVYGFSTGIHLHVSIHTKDVSEKAKAEMLDTGMKCLSKYFKIDGITFGWYKYDDYLNNLCKINNLAVMHYNFFSVNLHDYDLPISKSKIAEEWLRALVRKLR
ncbi:MAG: hypothetical protein PHD81_00625 [Candidatus Nanoarchaeia archaeon]|nr:hypothetical protein [Candidatus Nanoarchaeia archaeon]MDD5587594.1 hypothetical protein [Candidatus Nanoarchaeia archaeon]